MCVLNVDTFVFLAIQMHVDVTNMFGICSFVVIVSEAEF